MAEIHSFAEQEPSLLGNIYIGRVKDVVKNIGAAFIEIAKGTTCYYALDAEKSPIYTKKINSPTLVAGDELLVQVAREAVKTKPPTVTSNLSFTGKYVVLTTGKQHIGMSNKLDSGTKEHLRELAEQHCPKEYGFIFRTNAGTAADPEILQELQALTRQVAELTERTKYLSCFSQLNKPAQPWLNILRDTYMDGLNEIITDDPVIHDELSRYIQEVRPEYQTLLRLYDDKLLPLAQLYSIENELQNALRERVWLKSGAYLVIQPTEALTVIDVNTGKYEGKKKRQDTFLKINLEAAGEIARQLRLRNISGIVIVDFINMDTEVNKQYLLEQFGSLLKRDPVKTVLVDMTPLSLVELTRKKVRKSLYEQLGDN